MWLSNRKKTPSFLNDIYVDVSFNGTYGHTEREKRGLGGEIKLGGGGYTERRGGRRRGGGVSKQGAATEKNRKSIKLDTKRQDRAIFLSHPSQRRAKLPLYQ